MVRVRVPKAYHAGAEKLANLADTSVQELLTALREEAPVIPLSAFVTRAGAKAGSISADDLREIVDALVGFYAGRAFLDLSIDVFAESVSAADELNVSPELRPRLRDRLQALLGLDSLALTSKAATLLSENERRFHDARIVTDIRTIFRDDEEGGPIAAVVVHSLRIRYHRDPDRHLKDIYIALDASDVRDLQAVLDRANAKASALEASMQKADIPYITVRTE